MESDRPATETRSWCSERMRSVFEPLLVDAVEQQARELLKTRKVLDFVVQPGVVTARVQLDANRAQRVSLSFRGMDDLVWERAFVALADKSYFLARMLAGDFPDELEEVFISCGSSLFPPSIDAVGMSIDGIAVSRELTEPAIAAPIAVALRLFEALDQEPFSLFTILGRGREETIAEIRRLRSKADTAKVTFLSRTEDNLPPVPLQTTVQHFWTMDQQITSLHYTIKADELPASILRWLDPIPLSGLEEQVDQLLEEGYARVARLAQSFGIGL